MDNLTGLMWLQDANCIATQYPEFDTDGKVPWQTALDFVPGINDGSYPNCGAAYTDWRLPNVNEFETLLNPQEENTAAWLSHQGFENVQVQNYWSGTTYALHTAEAWIGGMKTSCVYTDEKVDENSVWPVRAGQLDDPDADYPANTWKTGQTTCYDALGNVIPCTNTGQDGDLLAGVEWPSPRFTDELDGTVTDNLTGLIWLQDANCIASQYPAFDPAGRVQWQTALRFVAGINAGSYPDCAAARTDWRLPNRKELHSLTDFETFDLALPRDHPLQSVQAGYYWSSTTWVTPKDVQWIVNMSTGKILDFPTHYHPQTADGASTEHDLYPVWPVRSGS